MMGGLSLRRCYLVWYLRSLNSSIFFNFPAYRILSLIIYDRLHIIRPFYLFSVLNYPRLGLRVNTSSSYSLIWAFSYFLMNWNLLRKIFALHIFYMEMMIIMMRDGWWLIDDVRSSRLNSRLFINYLVQLLCLYLRTIRRIRGALGGCCFGA